MRIRTVLRRATVALTALAVLVPATPALAFKPYTHIVTGENAWQDATDDGHVTIAGHSIPVRTEVVDALRNWPSYYNAGVIGPDGFPDLIMGQSIIHPEFTGLWLQHLLDEAWAAQVDPRWSADERGQILAFAYGYLTHAAGDLWMHTMINELSVGIFPGPGDILSEPEKAAIALKHLIAEAYVGDATVGFDGNPNRTLVGVDISDDSTRHIPFDSPKEFIYRTLVRQVDEHGQQVGPTANRGMVQGFFHDLRGWLAEGLENDPDPLGAALRKYGDTKAALDRITAPATCAPEDANVDDDNDGAPDDGCGDDGDPDRVGRGEDESGDCSFGAGNTGWDVEFDIAYDVIACPIAMAALGVTAIIDSAEAVFAGVTEALHLALDKVLDAYRAAWIDDIDAGLENWPDLGLAITRGMFDPQTRRDLQNHACRNRGPDTFDPDSLRGRCENGTTILSTVINEADPFINGHLLSMLGLPDVTGDLRALLQEASEALDDLIGESLNPLRKTVQDLTDEAIELVYQHLQERYGVDVEAILGILKSPSAKMDITEIAIPVPGHGVVNVQLWQPGDHAKLDRYLGITDPDHHTGPGGGIGDDVAFDAEQFKAFRNTLVLNRLLLLDGAGLDQLVSQMIGAPYTFYASKPNANVMTTPFTNGTGLAAQQWLKSIDADHAWRHDGLPTLPGSDHGGMGTFPLWESCALRHDVFRGLFHDWENDADGDGVLDHGRSFAEPGENFPDLGDPVSADPNDPTAPVSSFEVVGVSAPGDGVTYVPADTTIRLRATDGFFPRTALRVGYTITDGTGVVVASGDRPEGGIIGLDGLPDGTYDITIAASDPCGTEQAHSRRFVLDTTPPEIAIVSPSAPEYDTDDLPAIDVRVTDALSGVASSSIRFDGQPATQGQVLDMFFLDPGMHEVRVAAVDRVGNASSGVHAFRLRATSLSLLSNLDRALAMRLIVRDGTHTALRSKVEAAQAAHARGQHATEHNELGAFISHLEAVRGKSIDPATADRFTAYARDLIAGGG